MDIRQNRDKLISALRSGDYKQGSRTMRLMFNGEDFYCPLGVACDVYMKNDPMGKFKWTGIRSQVYEKLFAIKEFGKRKLVTQTPPQEIMDYFGLTYDQVADIIHDNDSGAVNFYTIANKIYLLEVPNESE